MALNIVKLIAYVMAFIVWLMFMNIEHVKCVGYCNGSNTFVIQRR